MTMKVIVPCIATILLLTLSHALATPYYGSARLWPSQKTIPSFGAQNSPTVDDKLCSINPAVLREIAEEARISNKTLFGFMMDTVLSLSDRLSNFTCSGVCPPLDYVATQLSSRKHALLLAQMLQASSGAVPTELGQTLSNDLPRAYNSPLSNPRFQFFEKYSAATCSYWLAVWGHNLYRQIREFYLQSLSFFLDFELGPAYEIFVSGVSHEVGNKITSKSEKIDSVLSTVSLATNFLPMLPWVVCGVRSALAGTTQGFWDSEGPLFLANGLFLSAIGVVTNLAEVTKNVGDYLSPSELDWKQVWRYKLTILDSAETNMMILSERYSEMLHNDTWFNSMALSMSDASKGHRDVKLLAHVKGPSSGVNATKHQGEDEDGHAKPKSLDVEMKDIVNNHGLVGNNVSTAAFTSVSRHVAKKLPALRSELFCVWRLQLFKMILQEFGKLYYCMPLGEFQPIVDNDAEDYLYLKRHNSSASASLSVRGTLRRVARKTKSIMQRIQFYKELNREQADMAFNTIQTSSESSGDSVSEYETIIDKSRLRLKDQCFPNAANGTLFVTNALEPPYAVWTMHKTEHFNEALSLLGLDEEDFWLHWEKGFTCGGGGGYDNEIATPDPYVQDFQQQVFRGDWMQVLKSMKHERVPRGKHWQLVPTIKKIL